MTEKIAMMLMLSSIESTLPKAAWAFAVLPVAVGLPVAPALVAETGVGVKTPGLAMQELAAAIAAEVPEGAKELTVPLPAKLHD